MTKVRCLFCESTSLERSNLIPTLFNGKKFEYPKCKLCGLIFLSPVPEPEDLSLMYATEYHDQVSEKIINSRDHSKLIQIIKRKTPCKKVLDFGCGNGEFVRQAVSAGLECVGVEYNPKQVQILKKRIPGANFLEVQELNSRFDSTFDLIYLGDVLEHMPDPKSVINTLAKLLKPKGYFLIEGPIESNPNLAFYFRNSYFALKKKIKKERFIASHPPYHILFSNRNNQLKFFESVGLKRLEYRIFEVSWPFPSTLSQVHSSQELLKYVIGKTSVLSSKVIKGWGNKFVFLGQISLNSKV